MSLLKHFTRQLQRLLNALGLHVSRVPPSRTRAAATASLAYHIPVNCQIPELANLYTLVFGSKVDGFFVEVGAFDGYSFSNSYCLAGIGWSGILIEPIPEFANLCRSLYQGNDRIRIVECAAGNAEETIQIAKAGPLTTANSAVLSAYSHIPWATREAEHAEKLTVRQSTLDSILSQQSVCPPIDLLIVDVEGFESSVLGGFSLGHWQPTMVIIELSHTHPDLAETSRSDYKLQCYLERGGYTVVYKDYINTVLVRASVFEQ